MPMTNMMTMRRLGAAAAITLCAAAAAGAQVPNASPAAYGMAGNYTAHARGYEAVAWNPANLAMPGRPGFSLGIAPMGGTLGMDPIDFKMLHSYSGQLVDSTTRAGWVDLVRASGRERARIDGGLTPLALSVGPFGLQTFASTYSNVDLGPDWAEALLFGNAGANGGQPKTLDLDGAGVDLGVFAGGAVSYARQLRFRPMGGRLPDEHFAVGVTAKYVVGGTMVGYTSGSTVDANTVHVGLPAIGPDTGNKGPMGSGMGFDLSAAWSAGGWKVGVLAENVINTFKWDTDKLRYGAGAGYYTADSSDGNLDFNQPFSAAPQDLQDRVTAQGFKPAITVGASMEALPFLTVTADLHQQFGGDNAISIGPQSRLGAGAELRIIPFVPLRAGLAAVTGGWQAAGGFGIHLFGYELGLAGQLRKRGAATESGVMIGLVGIGR